MDVGHLLVEWMGATSQLAGTDSGWMGDTNGRVYVETVVGPFHHCSVARWGRQQQQLLSLFYRMF